MHQIKKKLLALVLCVCMTAALPLAAGAASASHWGQPVLDAFSSAGYLAGYESVNPDDAMTQAQFATLLNRITGLSEDASSNAVLTRQEAAVLTANALGLTRADSSVLNRFSDSGSISDSARQSVAAMVSAGYINGTTAGAFLPDQPLTWAEGVTILNNALGALRALGASSTDVLYGTADLTYAEYYSGDVSNVDGFGIDGITTATVEKYVSFNGGMLNNFTEDKTEGYNILGVKNVNVAVSAADYQAYLAINPSFQVSAETPSQYKTVTIENGKAVYSATRFNVVDTVTDAAAELKTGSTWGDYEIDVLENSTQYIRNTRSDEGFAINANIQGTILETSDGLKVGMEYLQSMWVQPWEVSFNVDSVNVGNAHIAAWDNLSELSKLVGKTVTSITFIMPDSTYVYTFDGIYIKPVYTGSETVSATLTDGSAEVAIFGIPEALEDVTVTITRGSGRGSSTVADAVPVVNGTVTMTETVDGAQTYTVKVSSSNYADLVAAVPMNETQRTQLAQLVEAAKTLIEGPAANDSGLIEHYEEAIELLASDNATSAEALELLTELPEHMSVYVGQDDSQEEQGQQQGSGHGH